MHLICNFVAVLQELSRELDDFCYTIEKLDKFTHALLDTSSESVTGDVEEPAPNLAGMLESTTISTSPGKWVMQAPQKCW